MPEKLEPLRRSVELALGESADVELSDGATTVAVTLLELEELRDSLRSAIRRARVKISVDGAEAWVESGNYNLPVPVGPAQVDCPVTRGFLQDEHKGNKWALAKDARLRLWPAGSAWIAPGTFGYPLRQRWFAAGTQMSNEPTFVNGGEAPRPKIYYHWGLDFGGAERMIDCLAAADGIVIAAGEKLLDGYEHLPDKMTYDGVYLADARGWFHGYFHLCEIGVELGQQVKMGQKIGLLGKEGGSGGWAHLHYVIRCLQPSGDWGVEEAYPYVWQAYVEQYAPALIAVARPHAVAAAGETVTLDAHKSRCMNGRIAAYEWTFTDGTSAQGPEVRRTYARPGTYSEILKVTGEAGHTAYDFATVQIPTPDAPAPSIHAAYAPTLGLKVHQAIVFKVRSFKVAQGGAEIWDFGDGTPEKTVRSDGNAQPRAADGYALAAHHYKQPGDYIVRAAHRDAQGETRAVAHLHVRVE
ncbi:MAG: PKD domain-containing protein [Kiritimatiellae bacterium]|nr:PKD domain-containing protein [Kiritimatiellia bacterium]